MMRQSLLLPTLWLTLAALPASAALQFDAAEQSLAPTLADTEAVAQFTFTNRGQKTVTITAVTAQCSCTIGALDTKTYEPGESGAITARLPLGDSAGTNRRALLVSTDDPQQPSIVLVVKLTIPPGLVAEPRFVYWKVGEEPAARTIRLTVPADSGLKITGAKPRESGIKATLRPADEGNHYLLELRPATTAEPLAATVEIQTELDGQPARGSTVYARVIGNTKPPLTPPPAVSPSAPSEP